MCVCASYSRVCPQQVALLCSPHLINNWRVCFILFNWKNRIFVPRPSFSSVPVEMNANTVSLFTYPRAVLGERLLAQRELEDRKAERERQQQQNKKRKRKKKPSTCHRFYRLLQRRGGKCCRICFLYNIQPQQWDAKNKNQQRNWFLLLKKKSVLRLT